jgi:putative methylase
LASQLETFRLTSRTITTRKHDLAIKLQAVNSHPRPNVALEQYLVPADLAAEILFRACYEFADIEGKSVIDLGAGTGRLTLGASMLGADYVVGAEIDRVALEVAARTCKRLGLEVDWVLGEIETLRGPMDTVVMNPPFGTKRPHADTRFLQVALKIGKVVYSIHKASTRKHLERWFREHNSKANVILSADMEIPHQFSFHKKRRRYVEVDVFRIVRS